MSKTIPEEAMRQATQIFADADLVETVPEAIAIIALALLARDERAAKIGDDYAKRAWQSLVPSQEAAVAAEHIASAIRDRSKT